MFKIAEWSHVVATGKLIDVALQVLNTNLVEGALAQSLEHCPERFQSVRVNRFLDVLAELCFTESC